MRNRIVAVCLAVLFAVPASSVHAVVVGSDDSPFLSLTRTPMEVSKLPTNVSVLTSKDLEELGGTNLSDVIGILPGVKTENTGSMGALSTVKIRGVTTSNQVQVLIDDQALGGASIENVDIGLIPLQDIDRIEVVRGGASTLYGANTIGGVIHIITKKAKGEQPLSGVIAYEGQSHQTHIQTNEVRASNKNFRGYVMGRRFDTAGYQINSDATNNDVLGSVGMTFAQDMTLDFDYNAGQQEQGTPGGTPVKYLQWNGELEREANTPTDRIDKHWNSQRLKFVAPLDQVMIQSVFSNYTNKREVDSFIPAQSRDVISANDTRAIFNFGLTIGGAYERDARTSHFVDGPIEVYEDNAINSVGAYIQQELNISKLTLIPALRWDQHSIFGNEYNPRVTAVYQAQPNWKWSANAARAVRSPTITDLFEDFPSSFDPAYDFFSNPELQPEKAWTYDVGTEVSPAQGLVFGLTGFYTNITDRIASYDSDGVLDFSGNTTNDSLANLSKAEISGGEFELSWKLGPLMNKANYTYQRAIGTTATSDKYVDLRMTPQHMFNIQVNCPLWRDSDLINSFQYVSHQHSSDNNTGTHLPPQRVWNIRLNQTVAERVNVFAGVDNVTNALYAQSSFGNPVPEPTRLYKGGVSFEFR